MFVARLLHKRDLFLWGSFAKETSISLNAHAIILPSLSFARSFCRGAMGLSIHSPMSAPKSPKSTQTPISAPKSTMTAQKSVVTVQKTLTNSSLHGSRAIARDGECTLFRDLRAPTRDATRSFQHRRKTLNIVRLCNKLSVLRGHISRRGGDCAAHAGSCHSCYTCFAFMCQ